MKLKSSTKITDKFNIDEIIEDKCLITFIDLSSETIEEKEESISYIYDAYQIELVKDEHYINENYDILIKEAKQKEYDVLANEIREIRKKLLEKTDNYAMSDRTMSDEMRSYRQELRDITKQEGFPYNVVFPIEPNS